MRWLPRNPPKQWTGRPLRSPAVCRPKARVHAVGGAREFDLVRPRILADRANRGSHAGLPHCIVDLLWFGVKVGELDVHLHHNNGHLSVGSTLRVCRSILSRAKGGSREV